MSLYNAHVALRCGFLSALAAADNILKPKYYLFRYLNGHYFHTIFLQHERNERKFGSGQKNKTSNNFVNTKV